MQLNVVWTLIMFTSGPKSNRFNKYGIHSGTMQAVSPKETEWIKKIPFDDGMRVSQMVVR